MDTQAIQIQALVTFLMPVFIQLLKRSRAQGLAWIDQSKPVVSVLTSVAMAVASATGISLVHNANSLTLSWPDSATITHGLLTLLVTFAGQHIFYESFWRHVVPSPTNAVGGKQ
jgi:hypothetical protein